MEDKAKKYFKVLKTFIKPFLVVFFIYTFAMLAVWRSGVSFADDKGRAIFGYAWTSDFNRFSSTAFGLLMNVNDRLLDISPWPQILGMGILAVVSIIITYVFCDKKIKYIPLILTAFIGLTPLTVECWMYKFDAPCIALSVLASVLPILWWPKELNKKTTLRFSMVTMFCMLVMWTTYQAASGIFPILCVFLAARDYIKGEKIKQIMKKIGLAVVVFAMATLIFKFCLPEPDKSYRKNEILSLAELIPGMLANFVKHLDLMIQSLNIWQKILVGFAFVGMMILVIKKYKKKSWVLILTFLIALPLTMGAYLLLKEPPFTPRSFLGVGIAFVPIIVMATEGVNRILDYFCVLPSLILLYSFMMFVLAFGNGLADQERWANYRVEDLVSGLSELYPDKNEVMERKIQIMGDIGMSKVMQHVAEKYPVTKQIVTFQQTGLSWAAWGLTKIRSYYNRQQTFEENYAYDVFCGPEIDNIKKDTYYYTIRDNGEYICVDLK